MYLVFFSSSDVTNTKLTGDLGINRISALPHGLRNRAAFAKRQDKNALAAIEVGETYIGGETLNPHAIKRDGERCVDVKYPIAGMLAHAIRKGITVMF